MPIQVLRGDIFTSTAQTLVCPVNIQGVMGFGLAKQFALRFPDLLAVYQHHCRKKSLTVVKPVCVQLQANDKRQILLWATKSLWRNSSRLPWIRDAIPVVETLLQNQTITSMALPALGCGQGELRFENIKPLLFQFDKYPNLIELYEPLDT